MTAQGREQRQRRRGTAHNRHVGPLQVITQRVKEDREEGRHLGGDLIVATKGKLFLSLQQRDKELQHLPDHLGVGGAKLPFFFYFSPFRCLLSSFPPLPLLCFLFSSCPSLFCDFFPFLGLAS